MAAALTIPFVLDVYRGDGPVDRGSVILQPITPLTDTTSHQAIYAPLTVALASPPAQVMLRACDDPSISPAGWTWTISFQNVPGDPPPFSFSLKAGYTAFTCPAATPAVFTLASGSAPAAGTPVQLAGSSLPGGFSAGTTYYVVTSSGSAFELAAAAGGSAIAASTGGSGTVGSEATQYLSSQQAAVTGGGGGFANPMTAAGDLISGGTGGAAQRIAGNTTATPEVLTSTGTGSAAGTPAWQTLAALGLGSAAFQPSAAFIAAAEAGAAGGVAPLDSGALLLKANLPNVLRSDYKFAPEDYTGGKPDVILVSDAAISSGSAVVTFASSQPLTSTAVDGGKAIYIAGAGAAGADYFGTISTVQSPSQATLSANAGTSVTGKGCAFGTDNTTQIRAAITDAYTFMSAHGREATLVFNGAGYGAAGAPVAGGSTLGNAMFPFAPVAASGRKARLRLAANADAAALEHWQQTVPQLNGGAIVVLRGGGTVDPTFGPPSVFGGPFSGYGAATSVFSNMQVAVDGMAILLPWDSGISGFDFLGMAEVSAPNWGVLAMATVPAGTGWPQITNFGALTRTTCGMRLPDTNNNDRSDMGDGSVEGLVYGFMPSEHATWRSMRTIYCFTGCQIYSGSAMAHGIRGGHLSAEAVTYAVGVMPGGVTGFPGGNTVKAVISQVDWETITAVLNDPSDLMSGSIGVTGNYTPGYGLISVNGGTGVKVRDLMQKPGVLASPHAVPASGTALANLYYRDAWVNVQPGGAAISAIAVDGTTLAGITAGAVRVPSGSSITLTYTAGTPAWQWILD